MKHLKAKTYEELKTEWYAKLKKSGFEDIEDSNNENLKSWSTKFTRMGSPDIVIKAKEDYYRLAGQFLYDHSFKDKKEELIWKMHSEGVSIRKITFQLKKLGFTTYKFQVQKVLKKLTELMVIKCR